MGGEYNKQIVNDLYHTDNDEDSPFWSRMYSDLDAWSDVPCNKLFNTSINNLNIKNMNNNSNMIKGMIMGHSPQFMYNKGINSACNNKVWRVDIGASKAFGHVDNSNESKLRKVQILVINNDNEFQILKEP